MTAYLPPAIKFQPLISGLPMPGGKVHFYVAGTSTPQAVYASDGVTPLANPLTLDANGAAEFRLGSGLVYKIDLKDATDTTSQLNWPVDNVSGIDAGALLVSSNLADSSDVGNGDALVAVKQPFAGSAARTAHAKFQESYSLKDAAANGDGISDDYPALAVAIAAGITDLTIGPGTYLVNSSIVMPSSMTLRFTGGILKVATGVTVTIAGPIITPPVRIFQTVGTGKIVFDKVGTVRAWSELGDDLCPDWWGAVGLGLTRPTPSGGGQDDTAAVQACFDACLGGRPVKFYRDYPVTKVTIYSNDLHIDFMNHFLVGMATGATTSVLEIKCGYSSVKNIKVDACYNPNYQTGIHWYTNDLNTYYPGANRFDGMYVRWAQVGLTVGALPSQGVTTYAQGTVQASGIATDAPVSESYIHGLMTDGCLNGVYMAQPNGKLTFSDPKISCDVGAWGGGGSGNQVALCALHMVLSSELTILGGALENVTSGSYGKLIYADGSGQATGKGSPHLNVIGTCMETYAPIFIDGDSRVRFENIVDGFGLNFTGPLFTIGSGATGSLNINKCTVNYQTGSLNNGTVPFIMSTAAAFKTSGFNTTVPSPAPSFVVRTNQVEFRDTPFWVAANGASFVPLVSGVRINIHDGWLTGYSGVSPYPRTSSQFLNDADELLTGLVDLAGATIASGSGTLTSGGWTFTVAGTANWTGVPFHSAVTVDGDSTGYGWQISTAAGSVGNTLVSATPKINISSGKARLFRAWMKTGSSGQNVKITAKWWTFAGSASGISASTDLFLGPDTNIGNAWVPVIFYAVPPRDACQMSIEVSIGGTTTAQTVYLAAPSLK